MTMNDLKYHQDYWRQVLTGELEGGPDIQPGQEIFISGKYFNSNGMQVSITAAVTWKVDWAAYIGATKDAWKEEETHIWTVRHGAKLNVEDAQHYFPWLMELLPYRR